MKILAIETSFDETSVAVTEERKVLSNAIYSQILLYKEWGGVVPSIAKRAHQERIDYVIEEAIHKVKKIDIQTFMKSIDYIAVTYGPGLALALETGIAKAKELAARYEKKIIPVNHMEGHIYSVFAQNRNGNPPRDFTFPYLVLLVSGAHTELLLWKDHLSYEMLGKTRDDAAGESLDKAARMLGFGYPGGPIIERLAQQAATSDHYQFPRPMARSKDLDFSFSGLKTSFFYYLRSIEEKEKTEKVRELASSFQSAVIESLLIKTEQAMLQTNVNNVVIAGGVAINSKLRKEFRKLVKRQGGAVLFPPYAYLNKDNAAMIGIAAFYRAQEGYLRDASSEIDRVPRLALA
ncbi:tRNA (adenosine(37)-N6)-threonylcarbamoyltransferase complex transferase subunit TsaD [Candidatus Roizmanbacteria bacterium]|nr:tRNA (adenosine(37)-N6)-threonylcarbamoyltransferase complex transferase subunit TsaD [Candidatus Roizmanbacteria bacterium]